MGREPISGTDVAFGTAGMETVLRRSFWMVDLAFLASAALLCALTLGSLAIRPVVPALPTAATAPVPALVKTALNLQAVASAFGMPRVEAVSDADVLVPAPAPKAPLALKLLGTLVSSLPEGSLALVEDTQTRGSSVYALGDEVQGAIVVSIERLSVVVNRGGELEEIGLAEPQRAVVPPTVGAPAAAPAPVVERSSDGTFTLRPGELQELIQKVPAELQGMAWVPAYSNGTLTGWKLARLAPNALLSRYGLAQGDVVRRINGFEVNDPSRLLEVVTRLSTTTRIDLELERHGAAQRLTYRVR